jgi:hypothetical protein
MLIKRGLVILFFALTTKAHSQTKYINLGNGSSSTGLNDPVLSNASCSEFDGYGGPVPNTPFSNWYAAALTIGNSSRGVQIMHGYPQYDELYFRGGTDGWHNWRKILHDANISSFALPLTGGAITGNITLNSGYEMVVNGGPNSWGGFPGIASTGGNGEFRFHGVHGPTIMDVYTDGNFYATDNNYLDLHAGNVQNYDLPLSGGTISGNLGIGATDTKGYKLAVNGDAIFTKIKVKQHGNWPDYVFQETYQLPPLRDLENYIREHKHLPEVPSAEEVKKDGLDVGENQATLLKKIEELTLYLIEQNKRIEKLEAANKQLRQENQMIKNIIKK